MHTKYWLFCTLSALLLADLVVPLKLEPLIGALIALFSHVRMRTFVFFACLLGLLNELGSATIGAQVCVFFLASLAVIFFNRLIFINEQLHVFVGTLIFSALAGLLQPFVWMLHGYPMRLSLSWFFSEALFLPLCDAAAAFFFFVLLDAFIRPYDRRQASDH